MYFLPSLRMFYFKCFKFNALEMFVGTSSLPAKYLFILSLPPLKTKLVPFCSTHKSSLTWHNFNDRQTITELRAFPEPALCHFWILALCSSHGTWLLNIKFLFLIRVIFYHFLLVSTTFKSKTCTIVVHSAAEWKDKTILGSGTAALLMGANPGPEMQLGGKPSQIFVWILLWCSLGWTLKNSVKTEPTLC